MRSPRPGPRPPGWRTVNATLSGILAGIGAVALARATLGPDLVLRTALVAVVAMAGVSGSLFLTAPGRRRTGGRRRRVHPVNWLTPVVGSVVAVLAWGAVAHSSGSGWVQAVGALMAAVLAVGLLAPVVPAERASVRCTASPADGQAGRPAGLDVHGQWTSPDHAPGPGGPPARATGPARGPRAIEVTVTPHRRGVVRTVVVEVASCAPFGLLWWAKEIEVALPRPLHVAPKVGRPGPIGTERDTPPGQANTRVPSGAGEPRGVRPYQPGDLRGSVHWPATSHVGSLMVRERERQTDDPVVIELVLPSDPGEAERVAEQAMAVIGAHLARGQRVLLGTTEPEGRRFEGVRDQHRPRSAPGPRRPAPDDRTVGRDVTMTLWQRIVQANRPGPAEHSVSFRTASAAAVIVAIAACWSQQELSPTVAVFAMVATVLGNVLSYWRREHPWKLVKPLLAVAAVGGFVWFITTARHTATPGDIATVEAPLAVLFAWVLCTHAFDVPARRDVAYSLAGSAALMAVAAAQSVDLTLGVYVVLWVMCCLWGLVAMYQSMSGILGVPWLTAAGAGVAVLVVAAAAGGAAARAPGLHVTHLPVVGRRLLTRRQRQPPDRRSRVAARPCGQRRRPDGCGRLPGLRPVPRHRDPRLPRGQRGHAGPGHPPELLGGSDL